MNAEFNKSDARPDGWLKCFDEQFLKVTTEIEKERATNKAKLDSYYDKMILDAHACQAKLYNLNDIELLKKEFPFVQKLSECAHELTDTSFTDTDSCINSDDRNTSACSDKLQNLKCGIEQTKSKLINQVSQYETEFKSKLSNLRSSQPIRFRPGDREIDFDRLCGHLEFPPTVPDRFDSVILNEQYKLKLRELCGFTKNKFRLLYRASRDGFTAADFHNRCDHQAPTLTMIKTTKNFIFGGFTQAEWGGPVGSREDSNAFLFSLVNKRNEPNLMRCHSVTTAIYSDPKYGPTFGKMYELRFSDGMDMFYDDEYYEAGMSLRRAFDIHISADSNANSNSYSVLGGSYEFSSDNINTLYDKAKTYLAGSETFTTRDIEVFHVTE